MEEAMEKFLAQYGPYLLLLALAALVFWFWNRRRRTMLNFTYSCNICGTVAPGKPLGAPCHQRIVMIACDGPGKHRYPKTPLTTYRVGLSCPHEECSGTLQGGEWDRCPGVLVAA